MLACMVARAAAAAATCAAQGSGWTLALIESAAERDFLEILTFAPKVASSRGRGGEATYGFAATSSAVATPVHGWHNAKLSHGPRAVKVFSDGGCGWDASKSNASGGTGFCAVAESGDCMAYVGRGTCIQH